MAQFSVTIVIPVWNQWHFTKGCLETLRPTLGLHDNVIVVNNGSEDFTKAGLKQFPWLTVIANDENLGFAKACNQGAAAATGDIVIFLNNDTLLNSRWIDGLVWPFEDASVAATGPRSNYVAGPQMVHDFAYGSDSMSEYRRWAKQWREDHKGQTSDTDRLIGFCMAVRRTAFEAVGGFDEQFGIGSYEDDDLSRRLIEAGGRLLICHESFVHHIGHATFEGNNVDRLQVELENRVLFRSKHQIASSSGPLLSACMIIKDEIDNLANCLSSLDGVVDEVVIYDTGSTDGSIELARNAGAKVIEGFWDDDFSRARNEALSHCAGEWILHIDADETFEGKPLIVREYLSAVPLTALQVEILNLTENNKNNLTHRPARLFKRGVWHWTGRLHEQVTPLNVGPRPPIGLLPVGSINHYGYMEAAMKAKNKAERNIRIAQIDADTDNGRDAVDKLTNLGRSLTLVNRHEEAMELFVQARFMKTDSLIIRRTLSRSAIQACISLHDGQAALSWVDELDGDSTHKDTGRYFRGLAYAELNDWPKVIEHLEGLENMQDDDGVVFPLWIADVKRSIAYASLGKWEKSADAIERAAYEEANDEAIWSLVAEAFWRSGRSLAKLFASIPAERLSQVFGQLALAPAEATDEALESLWSFEDRRNSVLALAIRTAPHLSVERALEWSSRLRQVNLEAHCPLVGQAFDTNLDANKRFMAATIAHAAFKDQRALSAIHIIAGTCPTASFEAMLTHLNDMAPDLLEAFITAVASNADRGFAMARALHALGATEEAVAVLHHALERAASPSVANQAATWLDSIGQTNEAQTIRGGLS